MGDLFKDKSFRELNKLWIGGVSDEVKETLGKLIKAVSLHDNIREDFDKLEARLHSAALEVYAHALLLEQVHDVKLSAEDIRRTITTVSVGERITEVDKGGATNDQITTLIEAVRNGFGIEHEDARLEEVENVEVNQEYGANHSNSKPINGWDAKKFYALFGIVEDIEYE